MLRRILFSFIALGLLSSCNSFNEYRYGYPNGPTDGVQTAGSHAPTYRWVASEPASGPAAMVDYSNLCPEMPFPDFGATPDFPIEQLKKLPKNHSDKDVDRIVEAHVDQLHAYILKMKRQQEKFIKDYKINCQRFRDSVKDANSN